MVHGSLFFLNTVTEHSQRYKRLWLIIIWSNYTLINLLYYGSKPFLLNELSWLLFVLIRKGLPQVKMTLKYFKSTIDCHTVDHYMCVSISILLQDMAISEWSELKFSIKDLYQSRDKLVRISQLLLLNSGSYNWKEYFEIVKNFTDARDSRQSLGDHPSGRAYP